MEQEKPMENVQEIAKSGTPILFIMGVSGSGKSTVGRILAERLGLPFFDGDDFHPPANVAKMRSGQALNDDDRQEWLMLMNRLARGEQEKQGAVIACSALKEKYRDILAAGLHHQPAWILLAGSYDLILERVESRTGHYMPPNLLQSQFDILETPSNAIRVDIGRSPEEIVETILAKLSFRK